MNEKVCPYCGSDIPADAETCPNCGGDLLRTGDAQNMGTVLESVGLVREDPSEEKGEEANAPEEKEEKPSLYLCPECGAFLSEDSKACPKCGVAIDGGDAEPVGEPCPLCGSVVPSGAEACPSCGTIVSGIEGEPCAKCGTPVDVSTGICPNCGEAVEEALEEESELLQLCPMCGSFLLPGSRTCFACGHPVDEPAVTVREETPASEATEKLKAADSVLTQMFIKELEKAPDEPAPALELGEEGLQICGNCHAFVLSSQKTCGVCGATIRVEEGATLPEEPSMKAASVEAKRMFGIKGDVPPPPPDDEKDQEGLLVCTVCGAFMSKSMEECPICETKASEMPPRREGGELSFETAKEDDSLTGAIKICKVCGAFTSAGAVACGICESQELAPVDDAPAQELEPPDEAALPLCPSCGAFVGSESPLCPVCGENVSKRREAPPARASGESDDKPTALYICKGCGAFVSEKALFCEVCQLPTERGPEKCPHCGAAVTPGAFICGLCGNALRDAPKEPVQSFEDLLLDKMLTEDDFIPLKVERPAETDEESIGLEMAGDEPSPEGDASSLEMSEAVSNDEELEMLIQEVDELTGDAPVAEEETIVFEEEQGEPVKTPDEAALVVGDEPSGAEAMPDEDALIVGDEPGDAVIPLEGVLFSGDEESDGLDDSRDGQPFGSGEELGDERGMAARSAGGEPIDDEVTQAVSEDERTVTVEEESIADEIPEIQPVQQPTRKLRPIPLEKARAAEGAIAASKPIPAPPPASVHPPEQTLQATPMRPAATLPGIPDDSMLAEARRRSEARQVVPPRPQARVPTPKSPADDWGWNREILVIVSVLVAAMSFMFKEFEGTVYGWFVLVSFALFALAGAVMLWLGRKAFSDEGVPFKWPAATAALAGLLLAAHHLSGFPDVVYAAQILDGVLLMVVIGTTVYGALAPGRFVPFNTWLSGALMFFAYGVMVLDQSPAWESLGLAYPPAAVGLAGFAVMGTGLFLTVRERIRRAEVEARVRLADGEYLNLDYSKAAKEYGEAIARSHAMTDVPYYSKGAALLNLGRMDEAMQAVDRALEINPENEVSWNIKGNIFSRMNRPADAVKAFTAALMVNPRYEVAWNNLGNTYARVARYDDALKCYDRALGLQSGYRDAWLNKGFVLVKLERYDEAAKCADGALRAMGRPTLRAP